MIVKYTRKVNKHSKEDNKMVRKIIQIDKEKCTAAGPAPRLAMREP